MKIRVRAQVLEFSQLRHVHYPLVCLQFLGEELGEEGIGAHYPSSGCDSICDVDEFGGEKLVEIFEESLFEELAVKLGYSIDYV